MRRRIYIAPDGERLEDVTAHPYRYGLDRELPLAALYDEPIWHAYLTARAAFHALECAVIGHLIGGEPYDDVERCAAEEAIALLDGPAPSAEKMPRLAELSRQVIAHAQDLHGDGDTPY